MDLKRNLKFVGAGLILAAMTGCYADAGYGYGYAAPSYGYATSPSYGYGYGYAGDGTYGYGYSDYPSAAYVATATPYYYEGRPTYWYNNRWNYMDGGRWNHYQSEPAELGRYRAQGFGRGASPTIQRGGAYGDGAYRGGGAYGGGGTHGGGAYRGGGAYVGGGVSSPSRHFYEKPTMRHHR